MKVFVSTQRKIIASVIASRKREPVAIISPLLFSSSLANEFIILELKQFVPSVKLWFVEVNGWEECHQ